MSKTQCSFKGLIGQLAGRTEVTTYAKNEEPRVQRLGRDILLILQLGGHALHHALEIALIVRDKTCFKYSATARHGCLVFSFFFFIRSRA